ncbi:MAG: mechanosensitive ion channel protein MscS [Opitutus sp.]|nr:mechanosensitive ion channel protein MscS [Opitutus sp.]
MILRRILLTLGFTLVVGIGWAQDAAKTAAAAEKTTATEAAAVVVTGQATARTPDFLEHIVDVVLESLHVSNSGNTVTHYVIAMVFLVGALFMRHVLTKIVFGFLKRLAARTRTTLDDKLFPALETPAATLIMLLGIVAALKVLKLSEASDGAVRVGSTIALSLVLFWGLLRAFGSVLDHAGELARAKQLGIAAFMPWIKKSLLTVFFVVGLLMIVQSMGFDVKALLAGLGIGGLAFALAAQDTIANIFGSIVVAIDQPFKIGEFVRIGPFLGGVEDIGLRSTKLRALDKSLVTIPNKTVAAEAITNLSRFTQRRVEQVIGLTYDTPAAKMDEIVAEIRRIIESKPEIITSETHVYFRDYSASSLDIWIVYVFASPDFVQHMKIRQQINLEIMRAVEARGLSFAFPTQTVHVASLPTPAPANPATN